MALLADIEVFWPSDLRFEYSTPFDWDVNILALLSDIREDMSILALLAEIWVLEGCCPWQIRPGLIWLLPLNKTTTVNLADVGDDDVLGSRSNMKVISTGYKETSLPAPVGVLTPYFAILPSSAPFRSFICVTSYIHYPLAHCCAMTLWV